MDIENELLSWRFNGGNIKENNFLVVFTFNWSIECCHGGCLDNKET